MVAHVAIALDGTTRGFAPDVGAYYGLVDTWSEDVTLTGADTIRAQEEAFTQGPPGPGPRSDGPLLAVVDSRSRVSCWDELRAAGYWRDAIRLAPDLPGARVDLAAALGRFAADGARVVRVDSGGRLIGALLERGLLDEVSLLVHPSLGSGPPWTDGVSQDAELELTHAEQRGAGLVWLRYALHYQ